MVEAVGGALQAQAGSHAGVTLSPRYTTEYSPPSTESTVYRAMNTRGEHAATLNSTYQHLFYLLLSL